MAHFANVFHAQNILVFPLILLPSLLNIGVDDQCTNPNRLGTNDLKEVLSQLMDAINEWYNLGLALGVQVVTLRGIKSTENNIQDCLREMLTHWLGSSSSRTWSDICNGLRSDIVKKYVLAEKIEQKYELQGI